jgi:LPXTG-site transpeptidase (sortase) family protein
MSLPKYEQVVVGVLGVLGALAIVSSSQLISRIAPSKLALNTRVNNFYTNTPNSLAYYQPFGSPLPKETTDSYDRRFANPSSQSKGAIVLSLARQEMPRIETPNLHLPQQSIQQKNVPPPDAPNHISIPAIKLSAPVQEVRAIKKNDTVTWATVNGRVAGWHNDSAQLGAQGNMVLNGHNNIGGKVFEHLPDLKIGQRVVIQSITRQVTYELYEKVLLLERDQPPNVLTKHAEYIMQTPESRLTLVTCWPPWDNSHRLLWLGRPVDERVYDGAKGF